MSCATIIVMKVATTIQLSPDEDSVLVMLKNKLQLSNKKAVVMEGLRALQKLLEEKERTTRLQRASRLVGKSSLTHNREWAPQSSAATIR